MRKIEFLNTKYYFCYSNLLSAAAKDQFNKKQFYFENNFKKSGEGECDKSMIFSVRF